MTNATLSIQNSGNKTELTNSEKALARSSMRGNTASLSLGQRSSISNILELNGEDFVILPVNGKSPNFNSPNIQRGSIGNLKPAPGSTKLTAYKAEKETSNEFESALSASLLSSLFPLGGLLESFKHLLEGAHKLSENQSRSMTLSETQNINIKDSLNPNKAFLPSSPFVIQSKPVMELWQKKRASITEAEKKKKKLKGLGSY